MQSLKNKTISILIVAILTFSMAASTMLIPNAFAHTPALKIQEYAYVNVAPNPTGVNQSITVAMWLNAPPMTANGPYGDVYQGFMINIIKPDGTNDTSLGPFSSDDVGGTSTHYTPTMLGTYTFQLYYPGQTLNGGKLGLTGINNPNYINDTILPVYSAPANLTVQQNPIPFISGAPLPTSYWQTPINALNVYNWYQIGGPYLDLAMGYGPGKGAGNYNYTSNFNPYSTAETGAHIMWTRPAAFGGVIGGDAGGTTTYGNYYSTSQYERKYVPIVINGYIFYTEFPGSSTNPAANVCVDLYTGKTVWTDDSTNFGGGTAAQTALTSAGMVTSFTTGQVLDYVSPNQYGGIAYLWTSGTPAGIVSTGTTLNMFDAMTGKYILSIVNGTAPQFTVDSSGDLIGYYVNSTVGTQYIDGPVNAVTGPTRVPVSNSPSNSLLEIWNSTLNIMAGNWGTAASGWFWRPTQNAVFSFGLGITAAYKLPTGTPTGGATNATLPNPWTLSSVNSGVALLYSMNNAGLTSYFQAGYGMFTGIDINTGNILYDQNISFVPYTAVNLDNYGVLGDGVFILIGKETGLCTAYSLYTGLQVWQQTLSGDAYNSVGGIKANIYGSDLLVFGFGGDIWSLKMSDGTLNWYTNTTVLTGDAGSNTPYGVWPIWVQTGIGGGGGIAFFEEGHEYSPPLFLGAQLLAINTTTGQLVWAINEFAVNANPELAYGIMTNLNAYDNQIYAFGMGPTTVTVNAPATGVTVGEPVTITGTVMDVSAGATQEAVAANFPHGLPAVSDASEAQFMQAVYMQQPMPHNIIGVPVDINVIDANNNLRSIGTTTSNAWGVFGFTWTPDISGNYTVIATFAGSGSYYGSTASTYAYATAAHPTMAPTSTPQGFATSTDLAYYSIPIIILLIIVIAIAATLLFRRRP